MISGLNQEVEILGTTFHFQTELSGKEDLYLRTEVFVGGQVVARREHGVDGVEKAVLQPHIRDHHMQTIRTFVARAKLYEQRRPDATVDDLMNAETVEEVLAEKALAEAEPAEETAPATSEEVESAPTAPVVSDEIGSAIRVRRFFGRVRKLIGPADLLPADLEERLLKAGEAFEWMKGSALFLKIRIDEQARCSLLTDEIQRWVAGDKDPEQAAKIWSGIVIFSNYLDEVNHRLELVAFDQKLLTWALEEIRGKGMTDELLKRLKSLYGRHPRFDRLLDEPEGISEGTWTVHLRSLLKLL